MSSSEEWPWLWGYDDGSILFGTGDGHNDQRIQDHPDLFAELKAACERYFAKSNKEDANAQP